MHPSSFGCIGFIMHPSSSNGSSLPLNNYIYKSDLLDEK